MIKSDLLLDMVGKQQTPEMRKGRNQRKGGQKGWK